MRLPARHILAQGQMATRPTSIAPNSFARKWWTLWDEAAKIMDPKFRDRVEWYMKVAARKALRFHSTGAGEAFWGSALANLLENVPTMADDANKWFEKAMKTAFEGTGSLVQ
jgi:hypothetical protein